MCRNAVRVGIITSLVIAKLLFPDTMAAEYDQPGLRDVHSYIHKLHHPSKTEISMDWAGRKAMAY